VAVSSPEFASALILRALLNALSSASGSSPSETSDTMNGVSDGSSVESERAMSRSVSDSIFCREYFSQSCTAE
jgi:hypothetical protein